jgi:hypothetical protein
MAMDTTLRPTTSGAAGVTGGTLAPRAGAATQLTPARPSEPQAGETAAQAAPAASGRLRTGGKNFGGALQDQVARAQQAIDYLSRVASQLESLKGDLSAKLSGASTSRQQLEAQVRQLTQTLQSRKKTGGGSVDANLNYTPKPAAQRFRIRNVDLPTLRQHAPQSIAFSVGSAGGPQSAVDITPEQSDAEIARAIDRAMAPMGVRAGLDGGGLVFSTPESDWPAVKDSIAVSGRGRVQTEEVQPHPMPQGWDTSNTDALRQNLREVVQALERVRRSQAAAGEALSNANLQVAQPQTPPPEIDIAADSFSNVAANTDYDSLLSLSSALVGVSRERVLALLGLGQ